MRLCLAISGAVILCLVFYLAVYFLIEKSFLEIKRKGVMISDIPTMFIIIILFLWAVFYGYRFLLDKGNISVYWNYILICGMAVLSIFDIYTKKVPNKILLILLIIWAVFIGIQMIVNMDYLIRIVLSSVIAAAVAGVVFFLTYFLSKKKLGMGDVKLSLIMGLYIGEERIFAALLYGALLCCVYS